VDEFIDDKSILNVSFLENEYFSMAGIYFLLIFLFIFNVTPAQNLISNGSFESFPGKIDALREVAPSTWVFINSVDIYLSSDKNFTFCNPTITSAQDSNVYLGFICYSLGNPNYREYALGWINKPLTKGHRYYVSFYLQYSCSSPIIIDQFHLFFLNDKINFPKNVRNSFADTVQVISIPIKKNYLTNWTLVGDTIIANGDEVELGFGNLNDDTDVKVEALKKGNYSPSNYCTAAYVFLDNVSLIALDSENVPDKINPTDSLHIVKINTIRFLFNDTLILPEYKDTLKQLTNTLRESQLKVKLIGYTDSIGNYNYNLLLSQKRANVIKNALIKNGISSDRISVDYKSYLNPVNSNQTESERSMNRRVEIVLMKPKE